MRSAKRQCRCGCDDKQSETEQILWPGGILYQDVSGCNCVVEWEALMPRRWRWADRLIDCGGDGDSAIWIRQMAIDSIVFSARGLQPPGRDP